MKYEEIIESFVNSGIPYDQFKDAVSIHKWHDNGWKFEIEDIPDSDFWEIDIINYAEEEEQLTFDQQDKLCKLWEKQYENKYRKHFIQTLKEELEND